MTNRECLEQSLAELQVQMERHREYLRSAFEDSPRANDGCGWSNCRHKQTLCAVLLDAVRILDDTRKAFKSKQLEALRKSFEQVLEHELREHPHNRGGCVTARR